MQSFPVKIAIVGLGPKGLYSFERILAQIKANPTQGIVEIHLFNKTGFMGSGDVYRSDQPGYLLMNFANKYINMWTEESPPSVIQYPLSFSDYIALKEQTPVDAVDPLYASRATVGGYLENGFALLSQSLPENVILREHIAEVRSVEKTEEGYTLCYMRQEKKCSTNGFQHIMITTGHQRHKETRKSNYKTVSFIYPVQQKLNGVTEQDTLAVKGMGLTFIDAILALTEGKGGTFAKDGNEGLFYQASGKEPNGIYPFSKSGWPMMPKYDFNCNDIPHNLYVKSIRPSRDRKLSFKDEVLPLIAQDMEFTYYKTLFSHQKEKLRYYPDYEAIKSQIYVFHQKHSGYVRFSMEGLLEPEFKPAKSIHLNILDYLVAFTCANRQIVHEAQLRAAAVWRRISPVFNEIYSFSGLDAASHKEFDGYYFGKLNRIAFGPPPGNLKKIIALANAGIVDFQYAKGPSVKPHQSGFMLKNGGSEIYCDVMVDARIPKNSLEKDVSGLSTNLCENQLACPYINRDKNSSYAPGILEIDRNGNLINAQGNPENITLYGTPTEGIVHDNDTLSRTRNNFAGPWARAVIQSLMKNTNEIKSQMPKLSPVLSDWMPNLMKDKELLDSLFEAHGSPINIHYLPAFDKNIQMFRKVFEKYAIPHQLFYAHKANKSKSVIKRARQNGIGVDTASFRELLQALEAGVKPELLVVTAAIKSEKLLQLAVEKNVLVVLDNQDECDLLNKIAQKAGKQTPVGFRVSGFYTDKGKLYSRFGFDIDEVEPFIVSCCFPHGRYSYLNYKGLHFHLNGYSIEERGTALAQSIFLAENLEAHGLTTQFIDIGGGILVNYLQSKKEWETFNEELKKAVKGEREEITFNNDGLGYQILGDKVQGSLATYPFYNEENGDLFLEKVLNYRHKNQDTVFELLRGKDIEIRMEPGRSLLNQVGMTLAKVVFRKKDMRDRWLVGLEMNMSQLKSSSTDFLLDPLTAFIPSPNQPVEVYFTGAYCLEQDIILKRKIALPNLPQIGDVVGFVNTAGYMMHFFETQAHLFELSTNLSLETSKRKYELHDFKID